MREASAQVKPAKAPLAKVGGGHYLMENIRTRHAMNTTGPNRILDEFARLMTDAAGAAQGVRREVETAFRAQAERILNNMDIVQREEFEAVREMAIKARAENDRLTARLAELEARLDGDSPDKKPSTSRAKKS